MMPCAPSVRARAPLWECVSGNFPSLKVPRTCSFPPFVYMWEWRSEAKKLPSWRCKIKGKGRWKRATRSAEVEQLLAALSFRTRPREALSTLIYFIFHLFGSRREDCPCFRRWQKSNVLLLLFLLQPAVKLTFNVTFDLRTNTVRQIWGQKIIILQLSLRNCKPPRRAECLHRKQVRGHRSLKVIFFK